MSASEQDSIEPQPAAENAEPPAPEAVASVPAQAAAAGPASDSAAMPAADAAVPGIRARCAGRTSVGLVREHNEDNFVVANLSSGQIRPRDEVFEDPIADQGMMFAVCDGMGGAAAGEVASQMAVDVLVEALRRGGPPKHRDALARRLVKAVEEAGKRIFDASQKERARRGMGTTATVAVLIDKVLFLGEVGDSRAYLLRGEQCKQLTKDQSLVNQLIEAGHLTEDEAEAFEHSNIILQALGTSESVQVDLTFVELRRGDRLMLCSDGLSGLVPTEMLRTTLRDVKDPAACAAKLIEYAESAGGHDNITVVIADFDGAALDEATETDTFSYLQYPLPPADEPAPERTEPIYDDKTPAKRTSRKSSLPPSQPSLAPERDDDGESLLPRAAEAGEGSGSSLWIFAGVLALAAAGFVWFSLEPAALELPPEAETRAVVPEQLPPTPEPVAEPQEIEVNVHTDVQAGTLLVNGESKGELSAEQSRSLKLRPGAYRFEAQSAGSPVAVTVVTVRADADMPMDVFLQLPKGTSDRTAEEPSPEEGEQTARAAAPEAPAPSEQAPPSEPKVRRKPKEVAPAIAAPETSPKPLTVKPTPDAPAPVPTAPTPSTPKPKPAVEPKPPAAQPQDIPANPF